MTIAVCFKCGSNKFGSLCSCDNCLAVPKSKDEIARSLVMSDHFFDEMTLNEIGKRIASRRKIEFDPYTIKIVSKSHKRRSCLRRFYDLL
jgi:hypothetical protein